MKRSSPKKVTPSANLPIPPWIYINDPQVDLPNARAVAAVIPSTFLVQSTRDSAAHIIDGLEQANFHETVSIVIDNKDDDQNDSKIKTALELKDATIKHGCNFVSINFYLHSPSKPIESTKWGTNHLDLNIARLEPDQVAEKVYKWLFSVLSIQETLHLISESEMKAVDSKAFPAYEYCPIAESRIRPKDAKIQFVALITSKPEVGPGKRLTWTVADRTGVANFYFQHRGPESEYTWNWVLGLKLGERRALPRMPCVKVIESIPKRIVKAPFRATATIILGTGSVVKAVGHGIGRVGSGLKMGKSKEWIPEADAKLVKGRYVKIGAAGANGDGKGVRVGARKAEREVKVFNEKGARLWKDDDWDAQTEKGSVVDVDEKVEW